MYIAAVDLRLAPLHLVTTTYVLAYLLVARFAEAVALGSLHGVSEHQLAVRADDAAFDSTHRLDVIARHPLAKPVPLPATKFYRPAAWSTSAEGA